MGGCGGTRWVFAIGACFFLAQELTKDVDMLFNRIALQEYILIVAQGPKGGLVDKPGK